MGDVGEGVGDKGLEFGRGRGGFTGAGWVARLS